MPKRGKYKKVRNQPSITHMLKAPTSAKSECVNNAKSGNSVRSVTKSVENNNLTPKKRRRETGDSAGGSPLDSVSTLKRKRRNLNYGKQPICEYGA